MVRIELTEDDSLAAIRARSKFGMAIAAMIRMIATTISNSINEKPFCFPISISPPLYIGYRCDMVCWGGLPPPTLEASETSKHEPCPRSYRRTSKVSWSKDQEGLPESRRIPERGQRPSWLSAQRSDFSRLTVALRSGDIQSGEETTPSICVPCVTC